MKRLVNKVVIGIMPPLVTDLTKKMIPRPIVALPPSEFVNINRNVRSDEYIHWIRYIFWGFLTDSEFIDIGTPERYKKAINLLQSDAFNIPEI